MVQQLRSRQYKLTCCHEMWYEHTVAGHPTFVLYNFLFYVWNFGSSSGKLFDWSAYIYGCLRLFDDVALKLNLQALTSFLTALVAASHVQLFSTLSQHAGSSDIPGSVKRWWPRRAQSSRGSTGPLSGGSQLLLLHRVGDVMLKTVHSGRPLIHVMRAWSVVGPHLMEVTVTCDLNLFHLA
jgi:hypothetical protein